MIDNAALAAESPAPMSAYVPDLYDLTTSRSTSGDVSWYVDLARRSDGPVLELGAGTGRIAVPVAEAGSEIHGLDVDSAMLDRLRRRVAAMPALAAKVALTQGDMRSFSLPMRFSLVIAPFRVLLHNRDEQELAECLRCVHDHLRPGGTFAFDVFYPSAAFIVANSGTLKGGWRWTGTHQLEDGESICCSEAYSYDSARQRMVALRRYEWVDHGGWVRHQRIQRFELSYFYPGDVRLALERAGFEEITLSGGFDGRPLVDETDEIVATARRPS